MKAAFLNRRRKPFSHSAGLGSINEAAVIEEVSVSRNPKDRGRIIVTNGYMPETSLNFAPGMDLTFHARLSGAGYFFATFTDDGTPNLLFVVPAAFRVSKTVYLETKLENLQFHIAQQIPPNISTSRLDRDSRTFLRNNPDSYSTLGFIPDEPSTGTAISTNWNGRINDHSWKYGYTGTYVKTKGKDTAWWGNFDTSFCGTGSVYAFTKDGWNVIEQNSYYGYVGTPLCVVGQIAAYRDTIGMGGKYYMYGHKDSQYDTDKEVAGNSVALVPRNFMKHWAKDHKLYDGKSQTGARIRPGGHVKNNFRTSQAYLRDEGKDYFAKVEWWNPETNEWSLPLIHPPWNLKLSKVGRFAAYFRFPRQLNTTDDFYDKTPQWQLEKTWDCYPDAQNDADGKPKRIFTRVGGPLSASGGNIATDYEGEVLMAAPESPPYVIMLAPDRRNSADSGGSGLSGGFIKDWHSSSYIPVMGTNSVGAVDPLRMSYAENPDILKAYWKGGNFKPGGTFMVIGKALDMFLQLWVSSDKLDGDNNPMAMVGQEADLGIVRDKVTNPPNSRPGDRPEPAGVFRTTDIGNPEKLASIQTQWGECFPGVPLNEDILKLMLRGDQLPELEGIENTKLPGFIEEDPFRYEVEYKKIKYRHPYTIAFYKLPEAWWGPTLEFVTDAANSELTEESPSTVYVGGMNAYFYIKQEQVDLKLEIEYQRTLMSAGYSAAEATAASNLEHTTVDVTEAAYTAQQIINEGLQDEADAEKDSKAWWPVRHEMVNNRRSNIMFGGLGDVGQLEDVTNQYSADHNLGALSNNNVRQYGFNELYLVNGLDGGPSIVITPPSEPEAAPAVQNSNIVHFGSSNKGALRARSTGVGNPMTVSTEMKQFGNLQSFSSNLAGPTEILEDYMLKVLPTPEQVISRGTLALMLIGGIYMAGPIARAVGTVAVGVPKGIMQLKESSNRTKTTKFELLRAESRHRQQIRDMT